MLSDTLGWIVAAASVRPPGVWCRTALTCRRRPARKPCGGYLRTRAIDVPSCVMWTCDRCGDTGTVRDWHRSDWNLRSAMGSERTERIDVVMTSSQYDLLRSSGRFAAVAAAIGQRDDVVLVRGTARQLEQLLEAIVERSQYEQSRARQRRCDEIIDALNAVLLAARKRTHARG